jgi:hypothetical protein
MTIEAQRTIELVHMDSTLGVLCGCNVSGHAPPGDIHPVEKDSRKDVKFEIIRSFASASVFRVREFEAKQSPPRRLHSTAAASNVSDLVARTTRPLRHMRTVGDSFQISRCRKERSPFGAWQLRCSIEKLR